MLLCAAQSQQVADTLKVSGSWSIELCAALCCPESAGCGYIESLWSLGYRHRAAHCGAAKGQLETLRILAAHGANLWLRNVRGDFPLHDAVQSGRRDLVLWLIRQRPDAVNAPNNDGRCPLHIAALHNNVEMCKVQCRVDTPREEMFNTQLN